MYGADACIGTTPYSDFNNFTIYWELCEQKQENGIVQYTAYFESNK